jgi:hypothetical protein
VTSVLHSQKSGQHVPRNSSELFFREETDDARRRGQARPYSADLAGFDCFSSCTAFGLVDDALHLRRIQRRCSSLFGLQPDVILKDIEPLVRGRKRLHTGEAVATGRRRHKFRFVPPTVMHATQQGAGVTNFGPYLPQ